MPNFNQRGPLGQGPMTGRRMGICTDNGAKSNKQVTSDEGKDISEQDIPQNFIGRGLGLRRGKRGRGFGFGRQNRFRGGDFNNNS